MAQIINTNIASLNAQRNLNNSQSANSTALERLSSGLRINSAKDDAAGLAISTKFESQTRGLNQAIRNAGDGISLAQTAEGALGSMTDNLQRVRELAVQSANATNSDEDRAALQQEVSALVAEITRTADETNFNGRNLFDGKFNGTFQIGANAGQTVDVQIGELTAERLGASSQAGVSAQSTDTAISNGDLVINGVSIRSSTASDDNASTDNGSASAIAKTAAINDSYEETGVKAFADENKVNGSVMDAEAIKGTVTVNGIDIEVQTTNDETSSRSAVITAINRVSAQTGVTAVDSGSDENGVQLVATDGRNIEVSFGDDWTDGDGNAFANTGVAEATGLADAATYTGGYTLIADGDVKTIDITGGNGTGNGNLNNAGLYEGSYSRATAATSSTVQSATVGGEQVLDFSSNVISASEASAGEDITVSVGDESATIAGASSAKDIAAGIESNFDGIEANALTEVVFSGSSAASFDFGNTAATGVLSLVGADGSTTASFSVADYTSASAMAADMNSTLDSSVFEVVGNDFDSSVSVRRLDGENITLGTGITSVNQEVRNGDGTLGTATAAADSEIYTGFVQLNVSDPQISTINLTSDTSASNILGTTSAGDVSELTISGQLSNGLEEGDLVINGVAIGASNGLSDSASDETAYTSYAEGSGISIAAAINKSSDVTGVTAEVNETEVVGGSSTLDGVAGSQGDIYINNVNVGTITLTGDAEEDRTTAINMINQYSGQTGVVAEDNGKSISLNAEDGRNISVAIDNRRAESIAGVSGGTAATVAGNSLPAAATALQYATGATGSSSFASFDVSYSATVEGSEVVNTSVTLTLDQDYGSGGVALSDLRTQLEESGLGQYLSISGTAGSWSVVEDANLGGKLELTNATTTTETDPADAASNTGTAGTISTWFSGSNIGLDSSVDGIGEGDISFDATKSYAATAETTYSTVNLSSAKAFTLEAGTKGNDGLTDMGLKLGTYGGGEDGQFLKDVDISTFEGAQSAITAIDNALETVASQRAELGALQNRFESTVSNLAITAENLTAANSRIRDADFAAETAELSRTQVLQQAGISILAQANQRPQQVLSLLG